MSIKKLVLVLCAVGFLAYFNSLWNQFVWDDEQFIEKNAYITSFRYLPEIFSTNTIAGSGHNSNYYRPLTTLLFAITYAIWGLQPFGFHLANTILHIGAGILLFLWLRQIRFNQTLAFWLSLIFLVHPIQTEAVTYANSVGDSLYAFFLFLALFSFSRSMYEGSLEIRLFKPIVVNKPLLLTASLIFYGCSVLSKEIALATLPIFGVVLLIHQLQKGGKFRNFWLMYKPQILTVFGCALLVMIYGYLRLTVLNFGNILNFYGYENEYTRSLTIRLYTFARVIWTYLGLLIWPYPLHMERNVELIKSFFSPSVLGALGLFLSIAGLGIYKLFKRGEPWILLGLSISLFTLIPTSGIIPINGILYEHWLYVPMIGFFMIFLLLVRDLAIFKREDFKKIWFYGGASVIGVYITLTMRQNYLWSTPTVFYEYTLNYANSARLHNNLAMAYSDTGELEKAIPQYQESISMSDMYPQTHHNLGNTYAALGKDDLAEKEYLAALNLEPGFFFTYAKLVELYLRTKQYDKALPYLEKLYAKTPENLNLNLAYGQVLYKMGRLDQAQQKFDMALQLSNFDPKLQQQINHFKNLETSEDSKLNSN